MRAATRSATSRRCGRSGTAATATRCGTTGGASRRPSPSSPTGSPAARDLYAGDSSPGSSINFVTAHDGFTLADLVSYNEKHNDANLEDGRDGESHNRSWNCGAEGPTDDPAVDELRRRQTRNMLTTLLLSQGVPMLLAGDEMGRTQQGNNNAYCQDNELSWVDWSLVDQNSDLVDFVAGLCRLRNEHPVFRRRRWFTGRSVRGDEVGDIAWYRPDGSTMQDADWDTGFAKALGVLLNGRSLPDPDPRGRAVHDGTFLVLFNAHHGGTRWTLPGAAGRVRLRPSARHRGRRSVGASVLCAPRAWSPHRARWSCWRSGGDRTDHHVPAAAA